MTTASRKVADALAARSAAGELFVLDHPYGGLRLAGHLFACDEGIAFAEAGWQDPNCIGGHSMHTVAGEVAAAGMKRWVVEMDGGKRTEIMPLGDRHRRCFQLPAGPIDQGPRAKARHHCGNLCTGIGPMGSSRRRWSNQSAHLRVANSTASSERHGPRLRIISVLKRTSPTRLRTWS